MRTTVTLDDDVVREVRAPARRREESFKRVLNDSLGLGFSLLRAHRRSRLGLRPGTKLRMHPIDVGIRMSNGRGGA